MALTIGVAGILAWTYTQHPEEWNTWTQEIQRKTLEITGGDIETFESEVFSEQRDALLAEYDGVDLEYKSIKSRLEEEFNEIKAKLEAGNQSIEEEVSKFPQTIEEKLTLVEQTKADREAKIAEVRQEYEETKAELQALQDSFQQVQESVEALVE